MKTALLGALLAVAVLGLGCSGSETKDGAATDPQPLWAKVDVCAVEGPVVKELSVLKMPDEKLFWVFATRDGECRLYGALVWDNAAREPDECDIRFRSSEPLPPVGGACNCRPGRVRLQEGRATSVRCCEKYPDSIHCRQK
jgi:hypothetical protein